MMHCIIIFEKSGSTEFAVNLLCIETEILNTIILHAAQLDMYHCTFSSFVKG